MPRKPSSSNTPILARCDWLIAIIVMILAALPFLQVTNFSFVGYDDPLHVSEQPMVLSGLNQENLAWSLGATSSNLWHPLTWISYMVDVSWFGGGAESPEVHHMVNLVLHLGATLLFFLLLRSLKVSTLVSALVTLAFSVHPLHVEPVAWISSRKDVLCAFFSLAALVCYTRLSSRDNRKAGWFWITLVTMAAAMTSKPSAVVIPVLFLLIDYVRHNANDPKKAFELRATLLRKWPYLALASVVAATAIAVQYSGSHRDVIVQQDTLSRLAALPASLGFYIQHVLWPSDLCFDYAAPKGQHFITLTIAGSSLLLGVSCLTWHMRHRFPAMLVGWLWFLACLAPVLGFFYVGPSFTADRYTYLAIAGPAITLAAFVDRYMGKRKLVISSILCAVVLILGWRSYSHTGIWKNNECLFAYGVSAQPHSDLAQTNWARVCKLNGYDALALYHYHKALSLNASRYYIIYNHIAYIQYRTGDLEAAIQSCLLSLKGYDHYAPSHHLLGQLLEEQGSDLNTALTHLTRAYEIGSEQNDPMTPKYGYSCALAHAKRGNYPEAAEILQHARKSKSATADDDKRINDLLEMLKPYLSR